MQIGTLGDIVFEVSDQTVRTFDELVQRTAGRWEVHQPIGAPVKPEFLGQEQGIIEFDIHLNAQLGINPREEKEKIEAMVSDGSHAPLMLGNRPITNHDWYIEQCETTLNHVDAMGLIHVAQIHLTIREYPIVRQARS